MGKRQFFFLFSGEVLSSPACIALQLREKARRGCAAMDTAPWQQAGHSCAVAWTVQAVCGADALP